MVLTQSTGFHRIPLSTESKSNFLFGTYYNTKVLLLGIISTVTGKNKKRLI